MHVAQEDLAAVDGREPVDEGGASQAQRLDLGAGEHHARLVGVEDGVVVPRLSILRDELAGGLAVARRGHPSESHVCPQRDVRGEH